MLIYVISFLILLIPTFAYFCIMKPRKLMTWYKLNFQKMGYRVKVIPFKPLSVPLLQTMNKDRKIGDPFKAFRQDYKGQDVVISNLINNVTIDITHPDLIQDFYTPENIINNPKVKILYEYIARGVGFGIAFSEKDIWKRKRRIVSQVFNFDLLKALTYKIQDICTREIEAIQSKCSEGQKEKKEFQYYLLNLPVGIFSTVMIQCFFGTKISNQKLQGESIAIYTTKLMNDLTQQGQDVLYFLFGPKLFSLNLRQKDRDINRRLAVFRGWAKSMVSQKIEEVKKQLVNKQKPTDLIQALVKSGMVAQKKNENAYSEDQILQDFCTFFIGGTDTSSHFLTMTIYYIAKNPEVEKNLRLEIDQFLKDDDYSYENLKNLKYIDYIQKQTTRAYGPVNGIFPRYFQNDGQLKGVPIKKGTFISVQQLGNQYSEEYFKQPYKFRPERWISQCNDLPTHTMGGFGGGPRTCLGKHLAMLESKIALIKIMKRYKKITLPNQDFKMQLKFLYTPQEFKTKFIV